MEFKNWRAYIAFMSLNLKQQLSFRVNMFLSFLFRIGSGLLMIFVWTAVFLSTKVTSIRGFTLPYMYAYFFLISAIGIISINDMVGNLQSDIQQGQIAVSLTRPTNYVLQLFFSTIPKTIIWTLCISVPILIVLSTFVHISMTATMFGLLIIELLLAFIFTTLASFIIGSFAVTMVNIWGISTVYGFVTELIGGGVIPLNLMPNLIQKILLFLPFQIMMYTPAVTILGVISVTQAVYSILITILWIAILCIIARIRWKNVIKKITAAGG
jgi:ABC-2 type transport system permease protein